ncbi:hypothetical protein ACVWZ4_003823 [Bradyrhizobium sp. USDA 4472]
MGRLRPPGYRDLKKGDRLVLINPDNTRRVVEVTSVGEGRASGRAIGPQGPEGRVRAISSATILCREGEREVRCAANLVAGDLVYTPSHRSGVQYGKVVVGKNGGLGLLRWDESKQEWLKRPQDILHDAQWFAHESEPSALDRFFQRIKEDRERWEASSGRSGFRRVDGSDEYHWREKQRRWDLSTPNPTYFRPLSKWERGEFHAEASNSLIGVEVAADENGVILTRFSETTHSTRPTVEAASDNGNTPGQPSTTKSTVDGTAVDGPPGHSAAPVGGNWLTRGWRYALRFLLKI